jgi:hypothetical protein
VLVDAVLDRSWHNLPAIPERYKVAARGTKQPTPPGQPEPIKETDGEPGDKKGKDKQDN